MSTLTQRPEAWIDVAYFVELNGSVDLLALVTPSFIEQTVLWLPAVEQALADAREPELLELLHSMNGACRGMCAMSLANRLRDVEHAVRRQGLVATASAIRGVVQEVVAFNVALRSGSVSA